MGEKRSSRLLHGLIDTLYGIAVEISYVAALCAFAWVVARVVSRI